MSEQLVICGPTRFHAVDDALTAVFRSKRGRKMLAQLRENQCTVAAIRQAFPALEHRPFWDIGNLAWHVVSDKWKPGHAVARCRMIPPGPAITVAEAEARGLTWSKECAKALGLIQDPRPPLERATWKQSRQAYMHAIRCRTCSMSGIGGCDDFHRIATGYPDAGAKPRAKALT